MITLERLEGVLSALPELTIGLIGDLFLDRYLELAEGVRELSVETDLEAYQVCAVRNSPGALGTVMNNLAALGAGRLVPVTVLGDDGHGYDLLKALDRLPVETAHIVRDPNRLTPTYTKPLRPVDGTWQELNRLDVKTRGPISSGTLEQVASHLREVFAQTDGLIVLDQVSEADWGVVAAPVRELLVELADEQPEKVIFVDSRAQIGRFQCGTLKPNLPECLVATGRPADADENLGRQAAVELAQRTGRPLFCTQGERGMLVVQPDGQVLPVPGHPVSGPVDIVGAGDSATAGIVSALLAGCTNVEAAAFGNLVASITVQQLGTTGTASPEQLRARWHEVQ